MIRVRSLTLAAAATAALAITTITPAAAATPPTATPAPATQSSAVKTAATKSDGGLIAYAQGHSLKLTHGTKGSATRTLLTLPGKGYVDNVHLAADGSRILFTEYLPDSSGEIGTYRFQVRDTTTNHVVWTSRTYAFGSESVQVDGLSRTGGAILTTSTDGKSLFLYDLATHRATGTTALPHSGSTWEKPLGITPDNKVMVSYGVDAYLVNTSTGARTQVLNLDEKTQQLGAFRLGNGGSLTVLKATKCGGAMTAWTVKYDGEHFMPFAHRTRDLGIVGPDDQQALYTASSTPMTMSCVAPGHAPVKLRIGDRYGDTSRAAFTAVSDQGYDWSASPAK